MKVKVTLVYTTDTLVPGYPLDGGTILKLIFDTMGQPKGVVNEVVFPFKDEVEYYRTKLDMNSDGDCFLTIEKYDGTRAPIKILK